jgi:arylsulfatase A-like enzyme
MPNIAIVVLDTLRKDAFDKHFEWLPGTSFENAWSTSHWTVPAHGSLFTGQYPTETGVRARAETFDVTEQSLIETLSKNGYRTTAYSCNPYISKLYNFDRGFDQFNEGWRVMSASPEIFDWPNAVLEKSGPRLWRYLRSVVECFRDDDTAFLSSLRHGYRLKRAEDDGAQAIRDWIQNQTWNTNEFLFLNLMEAHTPYSPPAEYQTVEVDSHFDPILATATEDIDSDQHRQAYNDSVHYLSDMYQDIFNELAADFEYIFTLGDHGELLGEYGKWTHFHGIYPELTNIPLTVYASNGVDRSVDIPVSLLDIPQTISELTEIDYETDGLSLLEDSPARSILIESYGLTDHVRNKLRRAGVSENRRRELDGTKRGIALPPTYYGYETEEGFKETGEANKSNPEEDLVTFVDELDQREINETADEVPESVQQQLKDLGYA